MKKKQDKDRKWGTPPADKSQWTILDHHNAVEGGWNVLGEYLDRLLNGDIPQDSKLVLTLVEGALSNGEVIDRLPVKIIISPDNKEEITAESKQCPA